MLMKEFFKVSLNPEAGRESGRNGLSILFSGESQTEPLHKVGPQVLDHHLLHYVVSGRGEFHVKDRVYSLSAGESFFIFPGELQGYCSNQEDPWRYRWVAFEGLWAWPLLGRIGVSLEQPVMRATHPKRMAALFHRMYRVLKEGGTGCDLEAEGYFRLILAGFASKRNESDPTEALPSSARIQMEKAARWLSVQYAQPVTIDQIARELGYHRTHFSKLFRQHTGMTPSRFLLKIRMERAKTLMNEPLTVQQIASSVGYPDALYFSKQFKSWYGMSPSEYRQRLQH